MMSSQSFAWGWDFEKADSKTLRDILRNTSWDFLDELGSDEVREKVRLFAMQTVRAVREDDVSFKMIILFVG